MYIKPNGKDILPLFGLVFPYVYLLALLAIPFSYRHHKIIFFTGSCLLLIGIKPLLSYVNPRFSFTKKEGDLHVMTYNTMMGYKIVDKKNQFSKERQLLFNQLIRRDPIPDIICAQEASTMVIEAFREVIDYPYIHKIYQRGAIIISRYPIIAKGQVDFGSKLNSCLWADIVVRPGDTIRVYSTHLESNRLDQNSYEFIEKEEYKPKEAFEGIKDLFSKYPLYAGKRGNQAENVKAHVNASPHKVIVCGDLNDPPMSYTYRTVKKGLNDTFLDNGSGFGTTWTGAIPMLRIDYIFASKELINTAFFCLKSDFSDHYPVKASFNLN